MPVARERPGAAGDTSPGRSRVAVRLAAAAALMAAAAAAPEGAPDPGVTRSRYGTTRNGEAVDRYVLRNARGTTVGVLTYGGVVDEVRAAGRDGARANVVLALPDLAAYEARANFGSLVGRYANRIAGGGFTLDGRRYDLSPDRGAVVSHGGTPGWGQRVWRAEPCAARGCSAVMLRLTSPDGENGFPGRVEIAVTFELTARDELRLRYRATADRATVLNPTHHAYFNLGGDPAAGTGAQAIRVDADRFVPVDARRVPAGPIRPVAGTGMDLRTPAPLAQRLASRDPQLVVARGFDHSFVVRGGGRRGLATAACAHDPASGRTLTVRTTEPGVQLYTANGFDGSLKGAGGVPLGRHAGFALETQHFPDSPNRPDFPSTVLRPGTVFRSETVYALSAGRGCGPGTRRRDDDDPRRGA